MPAGATQAIFVATSLQEAYSLAGMQAIERDAEWSSPGLVDTQLSLSKMGGGVFSAKIETKSWQATGVHA